ncbi:hypothetical protein [Actinoplanes palleronii]|uniref:Integrase n=1 Tax=Actinoplanes palleronii TaxID=113570 RepID=A0ABQ4B4X5_9ACTN|nr:hypothetical protein [Actinoplanes palleronii]GIE65719.1 hypothetical protein Apa02nite_018270 [Actinoplanes palleronii]
MAHRTRGFTSHTFDIKKVLSVDVDALTIVYTDAAHAAPQTAKLDSRPVTQAGRQLLDGMVNSLRVFGDGDWESSKVLYGCSRSCTRLLTSLSRRGISDFADETLTLDVLREVLADFDDSMKRTLNKLLGRVLRKHHPKGGPLAYALANTAYMVKDSATEPYDDDVANAIEQAARGRFTEAYIAQRQVLADFGLDVTGRGWMTVPAAEIIDDALRRFPDARTERPPRYGASRAELIAWCLLHPEVFGHTAGRQQLNPLSAAITNVGIALHPRNDVLVAGLILQCLADDTGLNQATMLRTEPTDLIYTGEEHGLLLTAKARNHSEDNLPVTTESMFSAGGMVATLTALTRFNRHYRAVHLTDVDANEVPDVVNKIYVEHWRDCQRAEILTNNRIHHGWRYAAFDQHWKNPDITRLDHGLRFRALRNKSLERGIKKNPDADVHGHGRRTRLHYLAHVLPEHTLVAHATAAQDDIVEQALARFATPVSAATDGTARELADVDEKKMLDVVVGVCTTGGNDPDDTDTPCSLGLAACFVCPRGYRTADHVPGLLATVAFTEIIRDNDPDEWENGDAGLLHFYAGESLAQFPAALVETVRSATDLTPHILNVNGLYTELRR